MTDANITNTAINCSDGKIWSGFSLTRNQQGTPTIQIAKCGTFSNLNNVCDCEIVSEVNGDMHCPPGKFMTDYNSTTKKATCCLLCDNNKTTKGTYDPKDCNFIFKDKSVANVACPDNTFLNSITVNSNNSKLSCCKPNINSPPQQEQPQTTTNINTDKCKKYGLETCSDELIKSTENKCAAYGMRYLDSIDNKYKNTDSYMDCHVDNFVKLDATCKDNSIAQCNFYNLKNKQSNDINTIKNNIEKIDAIQNIYEKKFNDLGLAGNKTLTITLIILGLLITIMAIYIVLKNL